MHWSIVKWAEVATTFAVCSNTLSTDTRPHITRDICQQRWTGALMNYPNHANRPVPWLWLQMPWWYVGARTSATAMLTRLWHSVCHMYEATYIWLYTSTVIQIKYGLPYCVTCPGMSTDPGSLNPGTRHSRVPGWWDPGIRTNTGAGDTVLAKHT